ncbi:MAG: nucleoside phosphorylase, partial [Actinobacteria bacterium]|nr:nucleoside phosphorylase [Actinomycetota bacterium]
MRLHRSISPDRPLLVVALEEEARHLHPLGLPILVTGAGKVNAAVAVATTIGEQRPSSLINLGTAGALRS